MGWKNKLNVTIIRRRLVGLMLLLPQPPLQRLIAV
jgi:hypothetical protein